jgi:LysM repeat protein
LAADKKADSTARSTAESTPVRHRSIRRLPAFAAGKPVVTAAVAVVGVAGIAATAIALSSQSTAHAGAQPATPSRAASSSAAPRPTHRATPRATPSATTRKVSTPRKSSPPPKKSSATLAADNKPKTVYYTVQAGNTLSSISGKLYGNQSDWPVLYYANQSNLSSPNSISVGQQLKVPPLPAKIPAPPAIAAPPASTSTSTSTSASSSSTAYSGASSSASQSSASVNASDYSGFQACVISRESGGNSQVMNSSGHYGLYQFSESTWVAYGGSAADFGNASVAEQNQVFDNAMAAGGESNWAPYDGC